MTKVMRRPALEVIDKGTTTHDHPVSLLFVHGGCHSAWCWDDGFLDYFADSGFRAVALSLRGHGGSSSDKSLHRCSMADFVEDVDAVARTLGAPPVLIGHSMGGFIVQHYLGRLRGAAGVLMASIPPDGVLGASVRVMRSHPWSSLRSNVGGPEVIFKPPLTREHLFSVNTPQTVVDACAARIESESRRAVWFDAMVKRPKPSRVSAPMLVLGGADDGTITNNEVHATARAYRTEAELFPGMGHNMMLEPGWPAVAGRIETWLGKRGL